MVVRERTFPYSHKELATSRAFSTRWSRLDLVRMATAQQEVIGIPRDSGRPTPVIAR